MSLISFLVAFNVCSQAPYFFMEIFLKCEVIELSQSDLMVVIIQAFFGDSHHFGCILQIYSPSRRCVSSLIEVSPSLYKLQDLTYCPFLAFWIIGIF